MKKKIILIVVCAVFLLIFMSSSYGGIDPRYVILEHPWEHLLSPTINNDQNLNLVLIVINYHFYLNLKSQSKVESFNDVSKSLDREFTSSIKQDLNTRETKFKK